MLTGGVSPHAQLFALLPKSHSPTVGLLAPGCCKNTQPALGAAGNFDNSVPAAFDANLNQPQSENESVRSKLKLAGLAILAQVFPSKSTLPSISPGCCWL